MAFSTTSIPIYSAQMLVLISAAAIGAAIFRLPLARARLAHWRAMVVACLLLPWLATSEWKNLTYAIFTSRISSTACTIT
jgi:hypothetical protein